MRFRMSVMRRSQKAMLALVLSVAICGGCSSEESASRTPWDLGGTITLMEIERYSKKRVGIVEVPFGDKPQRLLAQGWSPWRTRDGVLYYLVGCGERVSRVMRLEPAGEPRAVTPCSNEIPKKSASPSDITFVAASPSEKRIAVEAPWYASSRHADALQGFVYDTVVFEKGEITARYEGLFAPAFLDEDTLVMASLKGLFITRVGGPARAFHQALNEKGRDFVNNPDVSPDGQRIVFERGGDLWVIDRDGKQLTPLVQGKQTFRYPVWSPSGEFIAFLATASVTQLDIIAAGDPTRDLGTIQTVYEQRVHFINPKTGKRWQGDISKHLGGRNLPEGQLSWQRNPAL